MKTHHLALHRPGAGCVCVAGTFNDWSLDSTPLVKGGDDSFAVELALPAGRHEYRFVVDGEWADDPQAADVVPNTFGSTNAVIVAE